MVFLTSSPSSMAIPSRSTPSRRSILLKTEKAFLPDMPFKSILDSSDDGE